MEPPFGWVENRGLWLDVLWVATVVLSTVLAIQGRALRVYPGAPHDSMAGV